MQDPPKKLFSNQSYPNPHFNFSQTARMAIRWGTTKSPSEKEHQQKPRSFIINSVEESSARKRAHDLIDFDNLARKARDLVSSALKRNHYDL